MPACAGGARRASFCEEAARQRPGIGTNHRLIWPGEASPGAEAEFQSFWALTPRFPGFPGKPSGGPCVFGRPRLTSGACEPYVPRPAVTAAVVLPPKLQPPRPALATQVPARMSSSMISKLCAIVAVLPNMAEAEQYFSAERLTARSTLAGFSLRPLTL